MKSIFYLILLAALIGPSYAISYKENVGPWKVEFNCSQNLTFQKEPGKPDQSGSSIDTLYLVDKAGHQLGWFALFSYSTLMKASEENFDNILDSYTKSFKVTSPVKTSIEVDGTSGRMAEGYASDFSRKWRGVAWAYDPFFDSFTNSNMTKNYVAFNSLLEEANFQEIISSVHVSSLAVPPGK
jgi:hypothetical protein